MNKASGGDGIPIELFQILKEDVVEVRVYAQQWDCWIIRQFYFQFFLNNYDKGIQINFIFEFITQTN